MIVEETFYRPEQVERVERMLPAGVYNLAHTLVARAQHGCVFVPIRSMQYLAVLDREEFIFVDRERRHLIKIAWRRFRPSDRGSLGEPVAYEAVYYDSAGAETMRRLQSEFARALEDLRDRSPARGATRILALPR